MELFTDINKNKLLFIGYLLYSKYLRDFFSDLKLLNGENRVLKWGGDRGVHVSLSIISFELFKSAVTYIMH